MIRKRISRFSILAVCLLFLLACHLPAYAEHVYLVHYNGSQWVEQDLTALTQGGIAEVQSGIAAFYAQPNNQLHVFYIDTNQHVRQLYYHNAKWSDQDLTALTGGAVGNLGGGISGFSTGNKLHVFFLGGDLHVHQFYYNNVNWTDQDITVLGGGVVTDFVNMSAFATGNHKFHVFYLANNSNALHQLLFNGSSWSDQNVSAATGLLADRGWMTGFAAAQNAQHLFLCGFDASNNRHLYHLSYNGSWLSEDVSAKVNGISLSPAAGNAAFAVSGGKQLEAYAVTNDFDVHQFTLNKKKWTDLDLTFQFNGPLDGSLQQMVAFATGNQFQVFYSTVDINQFYFNGTNWFSNDLTGINGQGNEQGGMGGFALGSQQYVFYIGFGN